jgi:large repetitive protein
VGCLPVESTLAIFTKQTTVTANTVSAAANFPMCYRDAVLADNPASYWRLDETSGTTAADDKGAAAGTYRNGVTLGQTGALPDTINNKAASFDAVDDDVQVGDVYDYAGTASFSVEFWMNRTATNDTLWRPVIAKEDPGASWNPREGWAMWLAPNTNTISMERWNGTSSAGTSTLTTIQAGRWYHIVATYNGSTERMYVNGTLDRSAALPISLNDHTVPLRFGSFGGFTDSSWFSRYAGALDDVAIYSTALSATQVRTHYNAGRCYKDAVLSDSALGYWRLGESAGATAADGIRGRYGTYVGSPTLNQTGALNGDSNPAVTFNGSNQYVTVPYTAALNPAQVTAEAWVKPTAVAGSYRAVVSGYDGPGAGPAKGYWLGSNGTNWVFETFNGGGTVATGPAVTLGTWTHLVGTYDGTTARLYVNGLLAASTAGGYTANAGSPLGIGATYYTDIAWANQFNGTIDEAAVDGTALSQTRVQAHYLLGRSYKDTVLDSGPVSYWRLGEAAGTSAADSKGSNTGTYTNGPTLAQTGALAGDADTSVSFDGSNDNVNIPYSAGLNPAQFTVELWADPTGGAGTYRSPVNSWWERPQTNPPFKGYGIWTWAGAGDAWAALTGYSTDFDTFYGSSAVLNQWAYLVETFDGTTVKLYVNGTLSTSGTASGYTANTGAPLLIGSSDYGSGPTEPFPGFIDEVAVYNKVLSATEIQLHYDSGRQ